jgi:hypothetical protein
MIYTQQCPSKMNLFLAFQMAQVSRVQSSSSMIELAEASANVRSQNSASSVLGIFCDFPGARAHTFLARGQAQRMWVVVSS